MRRLGGRAIIWQDKRRENKRQGKARQELESQSCLVFLKVARMGWHTVVFFLVTMTTEFCDMGQSNEKGGRGKVGKTKLDQR